MTLPSFVILVVLATVAIVIFVELATIPGRKAREREHPQADAINILGWLGLPMGGVPWVIAIVWAYTHPGLLMTADAVRAGENASKSSREE
jgi:hypothetical protein